MGKLYAHMKMDLLKGVLFLLLSGTFINAYAQGPGPQWPYSRCISLSTPTTLANYQVKVVLTAGQYTNMDAQGDDLRFYDASNNDCPYWIEKWDNTGTSIIWVKVVANNTSELTLYYGNGGAAAVSNGTNTFDWFDDFTGTSLAANWQTYRTNGTGSTVTVGGGNVTIANTTGNRIEISSAFTTASTAFYLESKFKSPTNYFRNRFYANTGLNPNIADQQPPGIGFDYGYFRIGGVDQIFHPVASGVGVYANVDYITQWALTDANIANNYTWGTLDYPYYTSMDSYAVQFDNNIRYINIAVTEQANTSTIVDWVRVRKRQTTDPVATVGPQQPFTLSATTDTICEGTSVLFTASQNGFYNYQYYVNNVAYGPATSPYQLSIPNLNNGDIVKVGADACGVEVFTNEITMTVHPLPTAALSADETTICAGEAIVFTADNTGNPANTNYSFKVDGVVVYSSTTNTYTTNAITNGQSVTVEVTSPSGCSSTSNAVNIIVNPLPTGSLVSNDADNTICEGASITFTATVGFTTYEFFVGGVSQGAPSGTRTFTTSALPQGVNAVSVEVTNGCTAIFNAPAITVNAVPTGTLSVVENSGAPNNNIICAGTNVLFTAPFGYTNYKFYLNGTGSPVNTNQALYTYTTTTLSNNDFITVVVTNGSGCTLTLTSANITVNPLPAGTLTADKNPICVGETVIFTATEGNTYKFYLNSSLVQNGASATYTNSTLTNGDQITVTAVSANGCEQAYNTITMVVNALPTGILTLSENSGNTADDGIICIGDNVIFTAPIGMDNYDFMVNGTSVQNGGAYTYSSTTLSDNDVVTVWIENASNCTALLNSLTIDVHLLPTIPAIGGTPTLCANDTTQLTNGTPDGSWSSSNTGVATISGAGLVTGVAAGNTTITYTVTNSNGCTDFKDVNVTVYAIPAPGAIGGTTSVCVGSTRKLTNSLSGGTWSSSNTGVATIDINTGVVTGISAGIVTITYTVTNANGCTNFVTASFEVYALPVVSAITAPTDEVCVGETVTYSSSPSGGTWSSSNSTIASVNASSGIILGRAAGTVNISYTVVNANGCSTTVSKQVIVHPLPSPTLTGANPICPDATETYTTENGQYNYDWTVIGGTVVGGGGPNDNTITVHWALVGTKKIFVNYENVYGCSAANSITVTSATGTIPVITGPTAFCLGNSGTYNTQTGGANYIWTVTGGNVTGGGGSNDATATVQWTNDGNQSISVNFTDGSGCTAASPTVYDVTVHPLPEATVSTAATSVCENSSPVVVTFTGTEGTAPFTFRYRIDGGAIQSIYSGGDNTATINIPTNTVTTHTVQLADVTDTYSCTQTQSGSVSIEITPLAEGTISGTAAVCLNEAGPVITFTGTTGTAPYTFVYNINGGANQSINTTSGNTVTLTAPTNTAGTFNYNLVSVSDANGCVQTQNGTAAITVNPLPVASISVNTTQVCLGSASPVVSFTGSNGAGPYTFTYTINGGAPQTVSGNPVANVNVPTGTTGSYTYTLVSVEDGSSTACSQNQSGSVTVQVDAVSVGGTLSGDATVCYGANSGNISLSGYTGNVVRWESSTDGGTIWSSISNTTTTLSYNNLTQTTQYRAVVQNGVCSIAYSTIVTITVNATSVGGAVNSSATVCYGTNNGSLTLTGNTGAVLRWESSVNGGSTWTNIANTTTNQTYNNITQTTMYRALVQNNPCSAIYSSAATITVNPLPNATASGSATVCQDDGAPAITFTGSDATGPYTFTYTINGGAPQTISGNPTATINVPTGMSGTYTYAITKVQSANSCERNLSGVSATVTVNPKPASFQITPATATICEGSIIAMTATGNTPSASSGTWGPATVNGNIPRYRWWNPTWRNSNISVSGIPAGAVITGVEATFNINHNRTRDLRIFLEAPNGEILRLVNRKGNGADFTNTIVSSSGTTPFTNNGNPFNGSYRADFGAYPIGTTNNWGALYSIPNGNWRLRAADFRNGQNGDLLNWSIKIYYQIPSSPVNVTWSPATDLYTDPGANTAYTGTATSVVYLQPSTSGTKNYTATLTNGFGCSVSTTNTINVNPKPVVTLTADYCITTGKVHLEASSNPAGTYLWSTGETTQSIDVDLADDYDVTVTTAQGCSNTSTISIARELVENGDFEAGNDSSFSSGYLYIPDVAGDDELEPDDDNRGYSITTNGRNVHDNFWGFDHTSGSGNFMAVNGHDGISVWEQTVEILPNTTYYFSGWARSLNNVGPFAQLVFAIDNSQVSSTAMLTGRQHDSNPAHDNWQRFYGTWTSGSSQTSIVLSIQNLEGQHGGNDFAIDDISFGTLTTFINLVTPAGSDAQEVCKNSPVNQISYSVGNGAPTAPNITGLPPGLTAQWAGQRMTITGTPTVAGTYTYSISTTGCNPKIEYGTITVNEQKVVLSNGSANPTICINFALPTLQYTISGKATGATVTGLPNGLDYSQTGNVISITGTPSEAGVFNYKIKSSGMECDADSLTGTITIQTQSISETSSNKDQTICINTSIAQIKFDIAGTATNAAVSGLPTGIRLTKVGNQIILAGSPTQSGIFNYTVTTSGTCAIASINGTLDVTAASIGGTLMENANNCSGTGSISLSSEIGTVLKWQQSTDYGITWTDISNNGNTQNFTGVTTPVMFRAQVDNGCSPVYSTTVSVGRHNYWIGRNSTDWNNPANWSDNLLPSMSCPDVYIPAGVPFQPNLGSGSAQINNLVLENGAELTVSNDANLQVAGSFILQGSLSKVDMSDGTLEMNGSSVQVIPDDLFVNDNVKDLIISNSVGVQMQGNVDVYYSLTFGANNAQLNTAGYLTLKSNKDNTAWIGQMTTSQSITGAVTVERYINTGTGTGEHLKAWQLLSFPVTGITIKDALQEGAMNAGQNPNPGYGIQLSGNYGDWSARGFDDYSQGASMKVYNPSTNGYVGIPNTFIDIYNPHGYFLFVRGNRTVTNTSQAATNVTLRSKGTLFTPANLGAGGFSMNVNANTFESVGNPYASAIEIRNFGFNSISQDVIVWDPTDPLRGAYAAGIFQTLVFDGSDYIAVPGGGVYSGIQNYIQSGQAFFAQAAASNGSITIPESAKASGSAVMLRTFQRGGKKMAKIQGNLFVDGTQKQLMDGMLLLFNDKFSNATNAQDTRKVFNGSENIAIAAGRKWLVVERRNNLLEQDTIFLKISHFRKRHYDLEFELSGLKEFGLEAWLEDTYLQQKTALNMEGKTGIAFEVNGAAGSYAADRFRIVFKAARGPLPVAFKGLYVQLNGDDILVNWKVAYESNMAHYELEHGLNGQHFQLLTQQKAKNEGKAAYHYLHEAPTAGYHYYRIKMVSVDGEISYSGIVKVLVPERPAFIKVYPNPIRGGLIQLHLINQPAGNYMIRLTDPSGKLILKQAITRAAGNTIEHIQWDYKLPHGWYQLEITKPDGGVHVIKVVY